MKPSRHLIGRPRLAGLWTIALALLLGGCGSAPTATPTPPAPTPTPAATLAPGLPTAAATATASATPVPPPATVTPAAVATATPLTYAAAQAPAASAAWQVRNLMVGPGRIYAFLVFAVPRETEPARYELLVSDDDGKTWSPFPGGLPQASCLLNVNLDYASADSLFVAACSGGIHHWTGSEWALISSRQVSALEVVYLHPQTMWAVDAAATGASPKVLRSDDGGSTWARADTGIEQSGVTQLGIDPRDSNTLYAMGPSLYRGKATGRWEMMQTDEWLPARLTGMAIEGGNGALYISLSAPNNQIWRSRNGNAPDVTTVQWELVHYFGEDQAVQLLATGPSPSGLALYANLAAIRQPDGAVVDGDYLPYRSPDGGNTWERIVLPGWIE